MTKPEGVLRLGHQGHCASGTIWDLTDIRAREPRGGSFFPFTEHSGTMLATIKWHLNEAATGLFDIVSSMVIGSFSYLAEHLGDLYFTIRRLLVNK
jgi:hypothetical protein